MIKRKAIYSLIYFGMVFIIGIILTHNEYISTALIIDFWFSTLMTLAYFVGDYEEKSVNNNLL